MHVSIVLSLNRHALWSILSARGSDPRLYDVVPIGVAEDHAGEALEYSGAELPASSHEADSGGVSRGQQEQAPADSSKDRDVSSVLTRYMSCAPQM